MTIIYTNILITIVSDVFGEVKKARNQYKYWDKVEVIINQNVNTSIMHHWHKTYLQFVGKIDHFIYYAAWRRTYRKQNLYQLYIEKKIEDEAKRIIIAYPDPKYTEDKDTN